MKIKGVDLSYCQEGISFPALKQAGVKFAIIRSGFSTKKDVTMDKFVADCKKYGIDYGFYWYSYAMSVEQAEAEAEKCISVIKELSPTYPVFFDMEEKKQISGLNTDTRTKMAIAFCEKIRQAGFKPGVYANPSFMENYYDKSRISLSESIMALISGKDTPQPMDKPSAKKKSDSAIVSVTLENVRAVCAEKSRAGFTAEVKSIITKHGADKLSAIKPEEYAAVLAEVEVLGNAD